jgi:hypothetical protein
MAWAYEGDEHYVPLRRKRHHRPIWRLWKEPHHAYATTRAERDALEAEGYEFHVDELDKGVAAYVADVQLPGYTALYRLRHRARQDTIFTRSLDEMWRLTAAGWEDGGVVGYVSLTKARGYAPLYRAYDPEHQDHLYSPSVKVIDEFGPWLDSDQLRARLRADLTGLFSSGGTKQIYTADDYYYCASRSVAKGAITRSGITEHEYVAEIQDCDDFAHLLKGAFINDTYDSGSRSMPFAMGIIWGYKPVHHAMNVIVLSDGENQEVKIIEPQNGTFHTPSPNVLRDIYLIVM